jgi:hypothetical protein
VKLKTFEGEMAIVGSIWQLYGLDGFWAIGNVLKLCVDGMSPSSMQVANGEADVSGQHDDKRR